MGDKIKFKVSFAWAERQQKCHANQQKPEDFQLQSSTAPAVSENALLLPRRWYYHKNIQMSLILQTALMKQIFRHFHLSALYFSKSKPLSWKHVLHSSVNVEEWDNHEESQRGKSSYIIWNCTRICLSWLRTRLAVPTFNISIISWDPSDPARCPFICTTLLRNDCVLWRPSLSSMSIVFVLALTYGKWCLKQICFNLTIMETYKPSPLVYTATVQTDFLSVIVKQKFDNIWPHLHMVYLDTRHRLSSQHLNFLSVLGGTRPLQAALSFPPYGILTVFSSLISL